MFTKGMVSEFDNIGVKNLAAVKFEITDMSCVIYVYVHPVYIYVLINISRTTSYISYKVWN